MDEQKKPFDIVSIVILILLALANDGAEIFCDLIDFTGVGLASEGIMKPVDFIMDGIFGSWFFVRCGFGAPFVIQLVDCFLELFGIPGRTICTIVGIVIANNPKLEKLAETAALFASSGATGKLTKEGKGLEKLEEEENIVSKKTPGGATEHEEREASLGVQKTEPQTGGEATKEDQAEKTAAEKAKTEKLEEEMEPAEEQSPETVAEREIFERTPAAARRDTEEAGHSSQLRPAPDGNPSPAKANPSNVISIDNIRSSSIKKAEEVKRELSHEKPLHDITEGGTGNDTFADAA
jgi:hypothetical protein